MKKKSVRERLSQIGDWRQRAKLAHYRAADLAIICRADRRALERFFKETVGTSPQQALDNYRQFEVEELLRSAKPLKEIAFMVGYKQPSHMTRQFKEIHGIPPSRWRRRFALRSCGATMAVALQ